MKTQLRRIKIMSEETFERKECIRCAERGKKAVMAIYGEEIKSEGVELATGIYDLIADLLHLARENDIEPDYVIHMATTHYQAEVEEEHEAEKLAQTKEAMTVEDKREFSPTPGPWEVVNVTAGKEIVTHNPISFPPTDEGEEIHGVIICHGRIIDDDARLISQAPTMYAKIKDIVASLDKEIRVLNRHKLSMPPMVEEVRDELAEMLREIEEG
jgi:copper chaperone CopZ